MLCLPRRLLPRPRERVPCAACVPTRGSTRGSSLLTDTDTCLGGHVQIPSLWLPAGCCGRRCWGRVVGRLQQAPGGWPVQCGLWEGLGGGAAGVQRAGPGRDPPAGPRCPQGDPGEGRSLEVTLRLSHCLLHPLNGILSTLCIYNSLLPFLMVSKGHFKGFVSF